MPVPFRLISDESFYSKESGRESLIDISFLAKKMPSIKSKTTSNKMVVTAADKNASLLMTLWTKGNTLSDGTVVTSDTGLTPKDILRLKTYGLVTGGSDRVEITNRGKAIITVMTLGETNAFEKNAMEKSYTEIMASSDKRGKHGYRMAFNHLSHLIGNA